MLRMKEVQGKRQIEEQIYEKEVLKMEEAERVKIKIK